MSQRVFFAKFYNFFWWKMFDRWYVKLIIWESAFPETINNGWNFAENHSKWFEAWQCLRWLKSTLQVHNYSASLNSVRLLDPVKCIGFWFQPLMENSLKSESQVFSGAKRANRMQRCAFITGMSTSLKSSLTHQTSLDLNCVLENVGNYLSMQNCTKIALLNCTRK